MRTISPLLNEVCIFTFDFYPLSVFCQIWIGIQIWLMICIRIILWHYWEFFSHFFLSFLTNILHYLLSSLYPIWRFTSTTNWAFKRIEKSYSIVVTSLRASHALSHVSENISFNMIHDSGDFGMAKRRQKFPQIPRPLLYY